MAKDEFAEILGDPVIQGECDTLVTEDQLDPAPVPRHAVVELSESDDLYVRTRRLHLAAKSTSCRMSPARWRTLYSAALQRGA